MIAIPYIDSIEFLTLAFSRAEDNVTFLVIRDAKDIDKYDRWVKASTLIDQAFKRQGGKATFLYFNVQNELEALQAKMKLSDIDRDSIVNSLYRSIAKEMSCPLVAPYSVSDYYLSKFMYDADQSPFKTFTKDQIYSMAHWLEIPIDTINTYRMLDIQRLPEKDIKHSDIEWASLELLKDGWTANLSNVYTDHQREMLQWAKANRYENR